MDIVTQLANYNAALAECQKDIDATTEALRNCNDYLDSCDLSEKLLDLKYANKLLKQAIEALENDVEEIIRL